jgi:DHA2 family lincomycin resistance protein-like MFS transporter
MNESIALTKAPRTDIRRGPIMIALLLGSAISLLNETLINVALTKFMAEFSVPATSVQWLSTGYLLVIGILVPVTAFLLDWFTTKQLFLSALGLFAAGTIVAGTASSFPILLVGRLIQATGTGAMVPLMMNTILLITPPEKHGHSIGLCMLVVLFAPAIAPTISGVIVQFVGWRWLFFFVLPFAAIAALLAARFLNVPRELRRPKFDLLSIILSTIGFGFFTYGVSELGTGGIAATGVPFAVGLVGLALFVWRQLRIPEPMLDMAPFKYHQFTLGIIFVMVTMMGFFANLLLLPMYLQTVLALSPFAAGFAMLPGGLMNGLGSPIAGKLYDRFGPRVLVPTGLGIMCVGFFLMRMIGGAQSLLPAILIYAFTVTLGMAFVMTPIQTNSLGQLPSRFYAHGTAIMNTLQQIAAALGSSLFIGLMASGQKTALAAGLDSAHAMLTGFRQAYLVGGIILACAFVASFFIRRKRLGTVDETRG